ncbi:hypothetical protein GCM10008905_13420 [Clostridium malenominatum]|uniref:Uncharacterized protein n=1 Tax=Clostridium malenominatum TaxID=1539 RepID=A0ABP3U1M1_9CLOT
MIKNSSKSIKLLNNKNLKGLKTYLYIKKLNKLYNQICLKMYDYSVF